MIWTRSFTKKGPSFVYHPYLINTQLTGSNAVRKEIPQIKAAHLLIEMQSRSTSVHLMKLVEGMPRVCKSLKAKGGYFEESQK